MADIFVRSVENKLFYYTCFVTNIYPVYYFPLCSRKNPTVQRVQINAQMTFHTVTSSVAPPRGGFFAPYHSAISYDYPIFDDVSTLEIYAVLHECKRKTLQFIFVTSFELAPGHNDKIFFVFIFS
jgi:hypothetical protein